MLQIVRRCEGTKSLKKYASRCSNVSGMIHLGDQRVPWCGRIKQTHIYTDIEQHEKEFTHIPESMSPSERVYMSWSIRSSDSSETCVVKGSKNFRLARSKPNKSSGGRLNPEFRTIDCIRWNEPHWNVKLDVQLAQMQKDL